MAEDETTRDLAPDDEPTGDLSDSEKLNLILHRLTALGQRKDTRPIWERALAEILEVKERMGGIEERMGGIEKEVRQLRRQSERLIKDLFTARTNIDELDSRVADLEQGQT